MTISKSLLLLILILGIGYGAPVSNRSQVSDLLHEILDEGLREISGSWQAQIEGNDELSLYLGNLVKHIQARQTESRDPDYHVMISEPTLQFTLNQHTSEEGNTQFLRQFNLGIRLVIVEEITGNQVHDDYHSLGGRDFLNGNEVMEILQEPFPVVAEGDYQDVSPKRHQLILLSTSTLFAVILLFFLRSS